MLLLYSLVSAQFKHSDVGGHWRPLIENDSTPTLTVFPFHWLQSPTCSVLFSGMSTLNLENPAQIV